ncbi:MULTISPECIES: hypothetical protein [Gracilibacillus]|uniref:Uncharacterized protein n=1 Tax=Gracilibacillus dipsosauri TaxID=178340 RepID=A0A317L5B3_9BACI|nr:hypothetical protein [Gracilibacillus dipsosauri]PWU69019.1 hypothetical protein DLJ74_11455 [Gracilibacillus dipsosauri]
MWETIWNQFVRISDFIFLTMRKELFIFLTVFLFILIIYLVIKPIIRLLIALEWELFLSFFIAIILSVFILQRLPVMIEKEYLIYTIVAFSIYIAIRRSVALLKKD